MSNTSRYHGIENHIGKTPLIRLRRLSELTGCEILGKAEFMNPGGSVKDRPAYYMIKKARYYRHYFLDVVLNTSTMDT